MIAPLAEHRRFWNEHPAMLLAICSLLGATFYLSLPWFCAACCWLTYLVLLRKWAAFIWLAGFSLYAHLSIGALPTIESPVAVTARFSPSSLQHHQTPFQKHLQMSGTLSYQGARLPCTMYIPSKGRCKASTDLLVSGILMQRAPDAS